jgi:formate hydrogenlyase subunit 6/NADH:ubiquinone oxidoreductase subunit I
MINHSSTHYDRMVARLNRFPQGAPPSAALHRILSILVNEREAGLIADLPIKPFTAHQAARIWKVPLAKAQQELESLASRAILVDAEQHGEMTYALPPPMAGFFEFSLMRIREDLDQQALAEALHEYCRVEDDFMRELMVGAETRPARVYVHEPVLPQVEVMAYERASEVIHSASHRAVGMCYCRHKAQRVDHACSAPLDICMTFNTAAGSLIRAGFARTVDSAEGLDLLQQAYENNLVQFGENCREEVSFICNCCGCCCEGLVAARRFAYQRPIATSNFLPIVKEDICTGCGKCVTVCPVEATGLVSANDSQKPNRKKARVEEALCLGCGLCARVCPNKSIQLESRPVRVITPYNGTHRIVLRAIERGQLQDMIFDNRVLFSHRALAALLGVLLRLPPLKQVLAMQQVKSRYLESLISRLKV